VSTLAALESDELSSESEIGCGRGRGGGASMDVRRREDMAGGVVVFLVKRRGNVVRRSVKFMWREAEFRSAIVAPMLESKDNNHLHERIL
jgi:hypothetical protein